MESYTVILKAIEKNEENRTISLSKEAAAKVLRQWKGHEPVEIGREVVPYTRIAAIHAPAKGQAISAPKWCGKCEDGWLFGRNGAYPCSCNAKGQDEAIKYRNHLENQSWYKMANNIQEKQVGIDSLMQSAEEVFNP